MRGGSIPSKDGQEGAVRILEGLAKVLKLLFHQEASSFLGDVAPDHRAVRPVGSAEGIIDVDIAKLRQGLPEGSSLLRSGFGLKEKREGGVSVSVSEGSGGAFGWR